MDSQPPLAGSADLDNPSQAPNPPLDDPDTPKPQDGQATPDPPPVRRKKANNDESIQETCESIVIAFILAFVFRAYVVEAFVIPTGSMAPTLLGQHMRVNCVQCGFGFKAEVPSKRPVLQHPTQTGCPMCHYANPIPKGSRISAGDRILVHKFIYSLTEPRRWDVIVFKNPQDRDNPDGSAGPTSNYIKRLVGLPQELLYLIEGNVYTRSTQPGADPTWRIARKTTRPNVQRAVWQPVYHSSYVPLDGGKRLSGQTPWRVPWTPDRPNDWELDGRHGYRHESSQAGKITFDFTAVNRGGAGPYYYNQNRFRRYRLTQTFGDPEPIEDIRVAVTLVPDSAGLTVTLQTTARLDSLDGSQRILSARIDAEGTATLIATDPKTGLSQPLITPVDIGPFMPRQDRHVELWYVDQEASLWIEGEQVLTYTFDLPLGTIQSRRGPSRTPTVAIETSGSPVTLHRVELDRDLYYSTNDAQAQTARGGYFKGDPDRSSQPVDLGQDQFFCLGDNSPMSLDSRYWADIHPWIRKQYFNDNEDLERQLGIIPRRLIMGRAFFVYFPAPLRLKHDAMAFIPNFGEMRFIH